MKAYPAGYNETTGVAQEEIRRKARPVLSTYVDKMDDYDVVFLGYPNWWGTMPMAVFKLRQGTMKSYSRITSNEVLMSRHVAEKIVDRHAFGVPVVEAQGRTGVEQEVIIHEARQQQPPAPSATRQQPPERR